MPKSVTHAGFPTKPFKKTAAPFQMMPLYPDGTPVDPGWILVENGKPTCEYGAYVLAIKIEELRQKQLCRRLNPSTAESLGTAAARFQPGRQTPPPIPEVPRSTTARAER